MQLKSLVSFTLVAAATAVTLQPANQTDHVKPPPPPPKGPAHLPPPPPPKPPAHGPPPPPPPPHHNGPLPGSPQSVKNLRDKIKYVIAIILENRSYDHLLGGQTKKGMNNPIQKGPFCNPVNITDPTNKNKICTAPKDYDEIINDPNHGVPGNNLEFYGTYNPDNEAIQSGKQKATMQGFVTEQILSHGGQNPNATFKAQLGQEVMNYYTEDQVPTLTSLVKNFLVFDELYGSIPGPTNGNRLYVTSGTSYGHGANDFPANSIPSFTIFEQLKEKDIPYKVYTNGGTGDPLYYEFFYRDNNMNNVYTLEDFFGDVASGNLASFNYLSPTCCGVGTNSMHPQGLVSDGERFVKDIYDTLRASKYWEETLLYITFDETGGFHDHMPPPLATPPDNMTYTTTTPSGQNYTFAFDRLGSRVPTFAISPWFPNVVEGPGIGPDGKPATYSATSLLKTLGLLYDFEPFNPRVKESASFDHLVLDKMRTDTPESLPEPLRFSPTVG